MKEYKKSIHYPCPYGNEECPKCCSPKNKNAVALGSIKTEKKRKSSRENGKLGGCPKKLDR